MTTTPSHAFDHAPMANCPFMPVFGAPAIMFERGSGTELWDSNGKRYLDFLAGRRELPCAAWANPTYNVRGWRAPCYLLGDDHELVMIRAIVRARSWS